LCNNPFVPEKFSTTEKKGRTTKGLTKAEVQEVFGENKGDGGRSDARYNFFVCYLSLAKEPLSVAERRITGGKKKVVAKEISKPFSNALITRESGEVEKQSVVFLYAIRQFYSNKIRYMYAKD